MLSQHRKLLFMNAWRLIKGPIGYLLFVVVIGYGLWHAPAEIWRLKPQWLLLSTSAVIFIFFLQYWQINVFLRASGVDSEWVYPALFNARKGVLNTILPARSGTILLMYGFARHYNIKWGCYVKYFLLTGAVSFYVSALALIWLLWPWGYSIFLLLSTAGICFIYTYNASSRYGKYLVEIFLIATGLYISTVVVFYCLLHGLGYAISIIEVSYFAIVLNMLAQLSITPGNIGVRELVMGMVAKYVTLPIAVGIFASSLLLVLRIVVYGLIWALLAGYAKRLSSASGED